LKKIILFLIGASLLMSCSVKGNLTLDKNSSGTMNMEFNLAPFFGEFFYDLIDEEILLDETGKGLEENKGISSHTIEKDGYNYRGTIRFDSFEKMVNDDEAQEEQTIFTITEDRGITTLEIVFNRENWDQMSVLVPIFSDPTIAMLGPSGSIGLTEDEYREMVIYPFEGYARSTEEANKALDSSYLVFTVNVPNRVISQKGGEVSGKSVIYRIPLIRMLMLDEELSYSVTYN
jgi:hypothetical protein